MKRILSALVLVPVFFGVVYLGFPYLHTALFIVFMLCAYEWNHILGIKSLLRGSFIYLPLVLLFVFYLWINPWDDIPTSWGPIILLPWCASFIFLFLFSFVTLIYCKVSKQSRYLALGSFLIPLAFVSLMNLYMTDTYGPQFFLLLFLIVWTTDINGYFVGKSLGGPKLAPTISPKKTWSGAIGGFLGAALLGFAAPFLLKTSWSPWVWAGYAGFISIAAQCGDLLESKFKRRFGVKDSGSLIPGHGGVLDRMDGFLLAAPTASAAPFFAVFIAFLYWCLKQIVGFVV